MSLQDTGFWKLLLKLIRFVIVVCNLMSTVTILAAVFMRYVLGSNFYGSDEIILLFAFWLYFIGAAHGSYENSHIKADLMKMYVKNMRIKDAIGLLAEALTLAVNTVVLVWSTQMLLWSLEKNPLTTSLKIPISISHSAIFLGMLLMEFYHGYYFFRNIRAYFKEGYYTEPSEGDYVSERIKAKYPDAKAPTKAQFAAQKGE
ncbi:MAG: TRAP transporter small permease [Synergistaceae bacterium]|nr:TRAP transporter small permease [Candidatus Equadaptatus faecalis]